MRSSMLRSHESCGVHVESRLVPGGAVWTQYHQFWFNGEVWDYDFPVGPSTNTPQQAEDISRLAATRLKAYVGFLADVDLETEH
jgi:cation diffusion facilitator CzcD-associated flavoprotein CzcO